jgi:hypothetical protein
MALNSQVVLEGFDRSWEDGEVPQQEQDGLPLTIFAFPSALGVSLAKTTILQAVFFDSRSKGTEATLESGGRCAYHFSKNNVVELSFSHADGTVISGFCDARTGPRRTQSRYTLVYPVHPA